MGKKIQITSELSLDEDELQWDFVRASGPGGQNVNKVATAVQLRFDLQNSDALPEAVRARLPTLTGVRITSKGVLIIEAKRFRSQEQNRKDALERLVELIRTAAEPPKPRLKTRPSSASKKRRLEDKHRQSDKKRDRKSVSPNEE